ncbi:tetratricopeptide repeat protein [uncultured Brachyspira sp.]|uniref:tetratricopeptide repeat protein n=1 Tax=uncultured Brachyspira sp. TaxID=221953 RepID=UPI00260FEF91|nr:tetratricopeptide repeat protein [uncultured Brachyspira sp.]
MNFTQKEQNYYELILDMLDDGIIDDSERSLLNKKKDRYGLSDTRAKEIEDFVLQEIQSKNKPKFNTEGEEEYYELLEDMLDDGTIDESERSLLNKRKSKYDISDERAEEFEDYIKSIKGIYNSNDDLLEQGKSYINDENYEEAIICFKKLIELEPHNTYNWGWLGASYIHNWNCKEAIECLDKAVELNQNIADHWNWLGRCYYTINEYERAIRCLKKAVKLAPHYANNWYWLGRSYEGNDNSEDAIKCLNKAGALIKISCLFILFIVLLFLLYSNLLIH